MINLISFHKAEEFLWIYINDYVAGKFGWNEAEAKSMMAAMFNDRECAV